MQSRPFESAGIQAFPTRASWDAVAHELLGTVLDRWGLTAGESYHGGYSGTVLRVTTGDGGPAVLKVAFPHVEGIPEAIGLETLGAGLAPTVLRQDAWAWALLLEQVTPGTPLSASGLPVREALEIGGELLARISAAGPGPGMPMLAEVVTGYADVARSRRAGQRGRLTDLGVVELVGEAIDELDRLAADESAMAFVHGDVNPGNLLRASDGWRVVDPKPMTGDPAYDLWPLVGQLGAPFTVPDPVDVLGRQLVVAASAAGIDPVRAIRWAFARSGLNVTWYLAEDDTALAAQDASELRVWAALRRSVLD